MPTPDAAAERIYKGATKALMAHTIRSVENLFYASGIVLHVLVVRDSPEGFVFKNYPTKASVVRAHHYGKVGDTPYEGLLARIFLRHDANHHLSRLAITHELYHLLIALRVYKDGGRKGWDGQWKRGDEPECNRFAQLIAVKHNAWLDLDDTTNKQKFPAEATDMDVPLELGDVTKLPDSLRPPGCAE